MNYYEEIKNELINNEITKKVKDYSKNKNDLMTYYNVGKIIIDAQGGEERAKYGDGLIKEYSKRLSIELNKSYSTRNLKYMRKYYLFQKGQPVVAQLTWSHYIQLLSFSNDKINYYINEVIKNRLSKRQLQEKIKNKEYERLPKETKLKLINSNEKEEIQDYIKNPIIINNPNNLDNISEKILQKLILEDIPYFLSQLGDSYSFIKNEYKISDGIINQFIDLLLFNIKYNCYVVVELKTTKLLSSHVGQILVYMNYIDKNIKSNNHDNTIGIIVSRIENKFVIDYSTDPRIKTTTYVLV